MRRVARRVALFLAHRCRDLGAWLASVGAWSDEDDRDYDQAYADRIWGDLA